MTFQDKRYFSRQIFNILKSSLRIDRKGLFDHIEYEVPFDSIHNKKTIKAEINNSLLFTGIFLFAFSFLFLLGSSEHLTFILLIMGVAFVIIAFVNRKRAVTIPTYAGEPITLYFNNGNKGEVVGFADQVIDAANAYLLNKYSKVVCFLPIDPQIENLQFLRNREIITEDHFEMLKNQLLGREGKSSIGFAL